MTRAISPASARAEWFDLGAALEKIVMSTTRTGLVKEIPLDKLKPSPANARKTGLESGIAELAASIAAQGLLQMPVVTPELDRGGRETGCYLVTAGERRRKALLQLVRQKRIKKTDPVPCLVRSDGDPVELSLAENTVRLAMHPADQFTAFAALHRERGLGPEEIAARFGVSPAVVRQRLRLAAVSPTLVERYRNGELTLDQLMAFAITDDHARQERAWEELSWNKGPEMIRKLLTAEHESPRDRRALFVGIEAYEAAGGLVLRDLFTEDHGGWLTDRELLDRLVQEKLEAAAEACRGQGWKWVEVHAEYPHSQAIACRRVYPKELPLPAEGQGRLDTLTSRYAELAGGDDETAVTEEVRAELTRLDAEIDTIRQEQMAYTAEDMAIAGVIVSLGQDGGLRVEKGLVKPEDARREPTPDRPRPNGADDPATAEAAGLRPLADALVVDLTAQRSVAIQECLASRSEVALAALTHALALQAFFTGGDDPDSCLAVRVEPPGLGSLSPATVASRAGEAMAERHRQWAASLPGKPDELWGWILGQSREQQLALLAYCTARTVDAVRQPNGRRRALVHADRLAQAVALDMTAWWEPAGEHYLARVPKTRILEAVREAVSAEDAEAIAGLKKAAMVEQAERLLAGKGWLPKVLRAEPATPVLS